MLLIAATIIAAVIVVILGVIIVMAFSSENLSGGFTLENFAELFTSELALTSLGNTAVYVLVSTVTAVVVGVPAAWLVARTDLPGRGVVQAVILLGVLIPGFFIAMGWLFMFHPNAGVVNQWLVTTLGLETGPFNIVSMPGMGFVQGLGLASVVFAMTMTAFRTMDVALEEASRTAGASFLQQLVRVTLPLAWPSILAATIYVAIIGFGAFDVPAIIGLASREYTFSTFLYYSVNPQIGFPKYGLVAAVSTFMIIVGVLLSWAYSTVLKRGSRYRVVTGKNYKAAVIPLRRWTGAAWSFLGLYFLLALIVPLIAVTWIAIVPFPQPPSAEAFGRIGWMNLTGLPWKLIGDAALNTLVLVLLVPTLALTYSTIFSWITIRSRYRFRGIYDYAAFIPHAVPNLILGVGVLMIALFVLPQEWDLYGSLTLIVILMSLAMLSFGTRMTNAGLLQLHPELEEAAAVSGAGTFSSFRRVVLPLLRPTLTSAWLWIAILAFRELTMPMILFSPRSITLSTAVWNLWSGGSQGKAAMLTLLMLIAVAPMALIYLRLTRGKAGQL